MRDPVIRSQTQRAGLYPKGLSAYALEPALVTQLPNPEAGSDTEASAFVVNTA